MKWWIVALCGLAILGGSCTQKKREKKVTRPVFLVSPQERDELQQTLLSGLVANSRLKCSRQALRGAGSAGRADARLVALVEPTGAIATCLARTEKHWADLRRAFFEEPRRLPGGPAGRAPPRGRPLWLGPGPSGRPPGARPEPALVAELRRLCAGLPAAVERAVQPRDACSPYLPGRRRTPASLGAVLRLTMAMVALARHRFVRFPREAAWMLLEVLRVGQDLSRGGPDWIWPLVARLSALDAVATLRQMLAANRLSGPALAELESGLKRLMAGEPALAAHLTGARQREELERYLLPLMPPDWVPPGGRPLSVDRSRAAHLRHPGGRSAVRQDLLVGWLAARRYYGWLVKGCRDVSDGQCLAAVKAVERRAASRAAQLQQRWKTFRRGLARTTDTFDREKTREAAVELLAGLIALNTSSNLLQAAQRRFYLAALRLHVAVLRAAQRSGWPTVATVSSWTALGTDPFYKRPLQVTSLGAGFEVRPASPLVAVADGATVRYVIRRPMEAAPSTPSPGAPGKSGRDASAVPAGPRPRTR